MNTLSNIYNENANNSLEQIALNALDCTVLLRRQSEKFEIIHQISHWSHIVISKISAHKAVINDACIFLNDFLIDAEMFWAKAQQGILSSGFWSEQLSNGKVMHFEALACVTKQQSLLIIKNVESIFAQQQKTLQIAREALINDEQIAQQVDNTHQYLNEIATSTDDMKKMLATIASTIEHATFGIMLLDKNLQPILQNPINYQLFQVNNKDQGQTETPLDVIFKLMEKQYPEHERIFEAASAWHGELYWLAAPYYIKWLKISIYPIKSILGDVNHWVFYISDITRIKHLLEHNEQLAHYDSLTKLPNRQLFWNLLEQNCSQQPAFYLLYLDIDNFKFINESYGHAEGDELLLTIAQRLQKMLKKEDIICRIGGDEFAILLRNINLDEGKKHCLAIAQRILTKISEPYEVRHKDRITTSASIGIVHFPSDATDPDLLMKYSDLAAYNAKLTGKGNIKFYSQELQQKTAQRIALENALREAIVNDEFNIVLQPMMDICTGKIIKAEALVRWQPTNAEQQIMPNDFIPLAEETGLIIPLGKLIFKQVCQSIQQLNEQGYPLTISINLSPKQIYDNSLSHYIYQMLNEYNITPQQIEFEITESSLANDFELVLATLLQLKKGGVSISVDDFGTGYSSLAYLKRLPVDALKIDRSFIKDIENDENDKAIVSAVIIMAHSLKLRVIAEGVENIEQLNFLSKMNCDIIQGYFFSKPIALENFINFIKHHNQNIG